MKSIQLQSIGKVAATEAQNIKVGSLLAWNFGEISEIVEIVKETASTIVVKEKSRRSGCIYERRFNKTRLVAIVG